jgi:EmrB/QacA subfamily drug resistance transporter
MDSATLELGPAKGRAARKVLIVTSLAAFMAFLDTTIVNIAFPALQRAFAHDPRSSISWVLNAYNIVFAALLIPAGQLADRYSRRTLFLVGLGIFTLASACCAISPTLATLIAFRMVQAVGAAILIPSGIALLIPAFAEGQQIKAIAFLAAISGVAFAAGPSLGGTLIHLGGWQSIFLINLPIGALTLLVAKRLLPEARERAAIGFPDLLGALLLLLGVALLALALVQGNTWGWGDRRIVACLAATAVLLGGVAWRATRHTPPAIELALFRNRDFSIASLGVFAFAIGLAAKLLCDVLFMTSVWHYSELQTGLAVSASPLITAALAAPAARLAIGIGNRLAAALGGALYGVGCAWYALNMGVHPEYLGVYLPGTLLTGLGIALLLPTLTTVAVLAVPPLRLAAGAGVNAMVRQLGAVMGIAVFVAIVGSPTPANALRAFHHGWLLAAIASLAATVVALALARPVRVGQTVHKRRPSGLQGAKRAT